MAWSWLRPGTLEYIRGFRRWGPDELLKRQQAFARGEEDVQGNHWCGLCHARALLINMGARIGYRALGDATRRVCDEGVVGAAAWRETACRESLTLCEEAALAIERRLNGG